MATPFTAAAVTALLPDENVPLLIVSVTADESAATVIPYASSTATVTAGLMITPAAAAVGCCRNASFAAAPKTVKLCEVAPLSVPSAAVSVYAPDVLIVTLLNVAIPFTAATVTELPPKEKVPLPSVSVTLEELPMTMFPLASSTATRSPLRRR